MFQTGDDLISERRAPSTTGVTIAAVCLSPASSWFVSRAHSLACSLTKQWTCAAEGERNDVLRPKCSLQSTGDVLNTNYCHRVY